MCFKWDRHFTSQCILASVSRSLRFLAWLEMLLRAKVDSLKQCRALGLTSDSKNAAHAQHNFNTGTKHHCHGNSGSLHSSVIT